MAGIDYGNSYRQFKNPHEIGVRQNEHTLKWVVRVKSPHPANHPYRGGVISLAQFDTEEEAIQRYNDYLKEQEDGLRGAEDT